MPSLDNLPLDLLDRIAALAFVKGDQIRLGGRGVQLWPDAIDPPHNIQSMIQHAKHSPNDDFEIFIALCVKHYVSRNTFALGVLTTHAQTVPLEMTLLRHTLQSHFGAAQIPLLRNLVIRRPLAHISETMYAHYGWNLFPHFHQQVASLPFSGECEVLFRMHTLNESTIVTTGCSPAGRLVVYNKRVLKKEELRVVLYFMSDVQNGAIVPTVIWQKGLPF
ncbi:hypothetical protein KC333_g6744 [Hortaea werneckii]|nr:hypothetical protein KC333_g6744 [Hortaea werneckii]KAI7310535.1 hypothetical protein KC326_g6647 [Hortaea werneckii]